MYRSTMLVFTAILLFGCATNTLPASALKELYEMESAARRMEPQSDVALLYLTSSDREGYDARLQIDNELSMDAVYYKKFYVYCLPPGKYTLDYQGAIFVPDVRETLNAQAGQIYVREFRQVLVPLGPIPLASSSVGFMKSDAAKEKIALQHIGDDSAYYHSKFRCRFMTNAAATK